MRPRDRALQAYLKRGGVIAYPTESCYGLGCDPYSYAGIRKILALKQRPQHKGLIVIASDRTQLRRLVQPIAQFPAPVQAQITAHWPGPYTFLLPKYQRVFPLLTGRRAVLAIRLTAHPVAKKMCDLTRSALVSTSANRSGKMAIKTYRECIRQFGKHPIRIIPGKIGQSKRPSTIINPFNGQRIR